MLRREQALSRIANQQFDLCIIGGGATGAGCALDAQLRGLKTVLLEGHDFGSGTSSASTKLIHGGVRYLEQAVKELDLAEYRVVRRALQERILMLRNAPHLSRPIEFVVPCYSWLAMIYLGVGLKLYDQVAGKAARIFASRLLSKQTTLKHLPKLAHDRLVGSVVYADGQFDDGRFNLALVRSMVEAGGDALNYAPVISFEKGENGKLRAVQVRDRLSGATFPVQAKLFVNATGPWADTIRLLANPAAQRRMRVSKGIHILLPLNLHQSNSALLIPKTEDGRVLFAVPWFDRLLVGTTDTEASLDDDMSVTAQEIEYVLRHLNSYLSSPIRPEQILSGTAGMRPLVSASISKDTSKLARDHEVEWDPQTNLISILGGKWTTYRAMAEDTIDEAQKRLDRAITPARTRDHRLSGSEQYTAEFGNILATKYHLPEHVARHLALKYGTHATQVIEMGAPVRIWRLPIVAGYSPIRAEILYAAREEMAVTIEDVLSRRTGLQLLSWSAARDAAPLTASILAKELHWTPEFERESVRAYHDKITKMLHTAGLPESELATTDFARDHHKAQEAS